MGRLIDEDILIDSIPDLSVFEQEDFGTPDMIRLIEDAPTVQAIPKADYENRLKADMVAMLTEIQLEIEGLDFFEGEEPVNITQELMDEVKSWEHGVKKCKEVIQQKINALKENIDGRK